jgi:hypothetical protein
MTSIVCPPDQPDGIDEDSRDLPTLANATARLAQYVTALGDGLYDFLPADGSAATLYGRDLEVLLKLAEAVLGSRRMPDFRPLVDHVAQAIGDPGSITERLNCGTDSPETTVRWGARAVMDILNTASGGGPR